MINRKYIITHNMCNAVKEPQVCKTKHSPELKTFNQREKTLKFQT